MKNNKPADRLFKQPTSMAIAIGGAAFAAFATSAALSLPAMAANSGNGSEVKGFATNTWNFIQSFVSESTFKNNQVVGRPMAAQSNALGTAAALELRTQAAAQLQQRDFIGADKTLRRALSLAPEGVSTQAMLAVAIDGQGRRTEARRMLDAMVGMGAAESASNVRLEELAPVAAAYTSVGDPRRALQIYNQMIAANFETAELHSGRGDAMQMLGDDLAALASYQLAAEVEPRFPSLELKRAASLEKLGRVSEAENAYRVALQLDPSSGVARGNLARLEAGRPAMASMVVEASAPKASSATAPTAAPAAATTAAPAPAPAPAPATTATATATPAVVAAKPESMDASAKAPKKGRTASAKEASTADSQAAIAKQLGLWQAAWSSKEITAYLGIYAKSFVPLKMNRSEWEADRRVKLNKPGAIQVNVLEPSFESQSSGVTVVFAQEYTSSNFRDKTRKRLDWVQEDGEWRIQREVTLPPAK